MDLKKALNDMKFDTRMQEYNIAHGVIKEEELKNHLQNLPDLKTETVHLEFSGEEEN